MTVYLVEYHHDQNDCDCSQDHHETFAVCGSRESAMKVVREEQAKPRPDWEKTVAPLDGEEGYFDGCERFYRIWEQEVLP